MNRAPSWLRSARDALRALDRDPGEAWADRLAHHGYRIGLVLALGAVIPWMFPHDTLPEFDGFEEGRVADRDVIAQVPFTVYKSEDQLEEERREAAGGVPSVYGLDPSRADSVISRVGAFFAALDSATAEADTVPGADTAAVREILQRFGLRATPEQAVLLTDAGRRRTLRRSLTEAFGRILPDGVAPIAELEEGGSRNIILRGPEGDRLLSRDSLLTVGAFYRLAIERAGGLSREELQLYQPLLVRFLQPTVQLDRVATRLAREQARSAVEASAGSVLKGERIITAHERIGPTEMEKLRAYQAKLVEEGLASGPASLLRNLGGMLFGAVLLGILAAVLYFFRPQVYREVRSFSVVTSLVLVVLAAAGIVAGTGASAALVPVAFAALLLGALYDGLLALVVVMTIGGLLLGQPAFDPVQAPFMAIVAGSAAAFGIQEVRRRSESWVLIAAIAGGYALAALSLLLLGRLAPMEMLTTSGWGLVNATASTALAVGAALPALEAFTGRTSDQTLLELADLNRPLLRRLSREAPGTYAHSISVANMSEAASTAIGADALLVRVGCYYHDIGKMERPQFFIENQPQGFNPHDRLPPSRSAEIIRDHVRDGLRLAEEAKLPAPIKDFIREHHGTQKIVYFYEKAKEEEPELELNPGDFCYPGPKPQTKETAIVMLADAVESASRTLGNPTPEKIRELIDRLVRQRLEDSQLDQCLLTFRELDVVKSEFTRVLNSLYHRRIEYPSEEALPPAASRIAAAGVDYTGGVVRPAAGSAPTPEARRPLPWGAEREERGSRRSAG